MQDLKILWGYFSRENNPEEIGTERILSTKYQEQSVQE